ncbi:MAG TPA: hypothetical protein VGZ25_01855 [Gemmataceae bacterium]|jgi:hypothetical protein|nr:hypothetical protein [Gemmataceae bacterium]
MTRHKWIVIITAGISATFGPGCLSLRKDAAKDKTALTKSEAVESHDKNGRTEASSYHPKLARELTGPPKPTEEEVRPAQSIEQPPTMQNPPESAETSSAEEKAKEDDPKQAAEKSSITISLAAAPPVEEPLVIALRCLFEKHPAEALEQIRHYDKSSQDLLMHLLPLAVRLTQNSLDNLNPTELSLILDQLRTLEQPIAAKASLTINKLCLVRREAERFGIYEKLPDDYVYAAGSGEQPGERVLVYAEFRNFLSLPGANYCETRLMSTLEIRDYQGHPVWRQDFPTPPDRSQTPRLDYFINYKFWVPQHLPPGSYTLWVQVKDVTGLSGKEPPAHRIARRSLDFRVTSHGTTHGSRGGPGVALQSGEGENDRRYQQARARKPSEP